MTLKEIKDAVSFLKNKKTHILYKSDEWLIVHIPGKESEVVKRINQNYENNRRSRS